MVIKHPLSYAVVTDCIDSPPFGLYDIFSGGLREGLSGQQAGARKNISSSNDNRKNTMTLNYGFLILFKN